MYQQALALDASSSLVNYEMSYTYIALKKYELAIEHANKVIASNGPEAADAYVQRGTAQDLMGNLDAALVTYKAGLKKFPTYYLLNYNIALTYYNQRQYGDAEAYAIDAIRSNPKHASSHLILGKCNSIRGRRVETLWSWYYFLLLEPFTNRSKAIQPAIVTLTNKGVKQTADTTIQIVINENSMNGEFADIDLAISAAAALKYDNKKKQTTDDPFAEMTKLFLELTAQSIDPKKKNTSVWHEIYIPFFTALKKANYTQTFINYISAAENDAARIWLDNHKTEVDRFAKWYEQYYSKK